jgi:hypothetical protein
MRDMQLEDHDAKRKDRVPIEGLRPCLVTQNGCRSGPGPRDVHNKRGSDFEGEGRVVEHCAYRGRWSGHD